MNNEQTQNNEQTVPEKQVNIIVNDEGVKDNAITQKQVDVVSGILKKGKRLFGSAGASLTHQMSDPIYKNAGINASLAKVGFEGEEKTDEWLVNWLKDKPQAVLVRSCHVRGAGKEEIDEETGALEGGDTDHLLIVGKTIIFIDSKNWKGKRSYKINPKGEILRGKSVFKGGKVHAIQAKFLWRKYLEPYTVQNTYPMIVITSEEVFVVRDKTWWKSAFKLTSLSDIELFLNAVWKKEHLDRVDYINANLITAIVINAIKPYNIVHEELGSVANLLEDD